MARKRVEEQREREMIDLGARNAELIPRLERWCEHLRVKLVSSGLLAEATRLPIGRMAIECQHSKGMGIQAMQLDQVAACFITENCRACPHHRERNPDNAGREILREAERIQQEEGKAKSESTNASRRLLGLVRGDLSQALVTAPTTEQSVLECVARLEVPSQAEEAAKLLVQAAELAAEFFNDLAREVIAGHFPDIVHGGQCAEAMRILGNKRGSIPPVALRAAQHCVEDRFCHDSILDLLADFYTKGGDLPGIPTVAKIVSHHGFENVNIIHNPPKANPGQVRALMAIGRRDLSRIVDAINRLLEDPRPQIRMAAPVLVDALVPQLPELGMPILDRLIRSLELDDFDDYGTSVDVLACDAIGEIFIQYPHEVKTHLETAAVVASEEGQELLIKVYDRLNRNADEGPGLPNDRVLAALPIAIDALISVLMNALQPLSVRGQAADTLSHMAWKHPSLLVPRLDALFGVLAIIANEHINFVKENPGGDPNLPGLPREEPYKYQHIEHEIFSSLEKLASNSASQVFDSTEKMLGSLNSKVPAQEYLKFLLVGLLERLSGDHLVGPRVVPPLFNALMDVESILIRSKALAVIEHMLGSVGELVPDNMRQMVVIYLRDPYKGIHKPAASAMKYFSPDTPDQAKEILNLLMVQYGVYLKDQEDDPHLRVLAESAVRICRHFPQFFSAFALPLLIKQARSLNEHSAREALEEWKRSAPPSVKMSGMYIREVLEHFQRCRPNRDDWDAHDPAHRIFLSLFLCDTTDIVENLDRFYATIATLTPSDPFRALQFLSVLVHYEQYAPVVVGAELIAKNLPPGPRQDWLRNQALLTKAAAEVEVLTASGKLQEAVRVLTAEESRLKAYVPNKNSDKAGDVIRSLSMADKIATRLRRV